MGVIPSRATHNATIGTEPRPFWRRITQALDRLVAQRSQRAVPVPVLRRSRDDIKRCHRPISQALLISQALPVAVLGGKRTDVTLGRRSHSTNQP